MTASIRVCEVAGMTYLALFTVGSFTALFVAFGYAEVRDLVRDRRDR